MRGPTQLGAGEVVAGRYKVVRALGSGGMGAVFEAENLRTGRRVALKVIHADLSTQHEAARRFEREARAAARVTHPNIVDILDLGDDPARGLLFLVQEFLEGESLAARLDRGGPLPVREGLEVVIPIADALTAVHAAGFVHRDVKPDNVFLHRGGGGEAPKLIDFGIVKHAAAPGATRLTHAGTLVGTPAYMSPEQARGDTSLDGRADVWSLGVLLYEALSGQLPFEAPSANQLLGRILHEPPRPLDVAIPAALLAAIDRALQKDPAARWPTMASLRDALRHIAWRLSAAQFDDRTTVMPGRATEAPPRRARPKRARAAALAALVVASGVGLGVGVNHAVRPHAAAPATVRTMWVPPPRPVVAPPRAEEVAPTSAAPAEEPAASPVLAPDGGASRVAPRPPRGVPPRREYRPRSI